MYSRIKKFQILIADLRKHFKLQEKLPLMSIHLKRPQAGEADKIMLSLRKPVCQC